ncbi:tagaturonate reductase [Paenibacillus taihuensis]|uniref:Tagaturonate reductase n=1 Tax=Paenibacillus taihuensis TaxID=1156355 RepID=A0A3D9S5M7_9BACL|nr:tagaturonate reductase [Paenibacillus taihuensis]REE85289.1 tagaturonate reductase [Paenibacillus taihuensis]
MNANEVGALSRSSLTREQQEQYDLMMDSPVTIVQIGEGNFLRGFFDWMVHVMRQQGLYSGSIALCQPRPSGRAKLERLRGQHGIYNLVTRGFESGEQVERRDTISVFSKLIDPYTEWAEFLALGEEPQLQVVVSNTTEAGLVYTPEAVEEGKPVLSYPGKLTLLLYRRFVKFKGEPEKGLLLLPCELLEGNGDLLRECVLRYARDWGLPEEFLAWVSSHNRFLNTLVDRIVTGYPEREADGWFAEWGYSDTALVTAEPYHLFAIEGEPELDHLLPLVKAGLEVKWTPDLAAYRIRKVRLLNGAHTLMTPLSILRGLTHVREVMEHEELGAFVRSTVMNEIIPAVALPAKEELTSYAESVLERFLNPFIEHKLEAIAMNSVSKFKARLLPSLLHDPSQQGLVCGFAALLRYYQSSADADGRYWGRTFEGKRYELKDDQAVLEALAACWSRQEELVSPVELASALLGLHAVWGTDLTQVVGLAEAIAAAWDEIGAMEQVQ